MLNCCINPSGQALQSTRHRFSRLLFENKVDRIDLAFFCRCRESAFLCDNALAADLARRELFYSVSEKKLNILFEHYRLKSPIFV